jgi:hypothetical protein
MQVNIEDHFLGEVANKAYRLIFRIENKERIEIICIEEINNHYG